MGIILLGYVVYNRLDTIIQEWVDALEIWQVYLGMYVLIFASVVVIVAPVLSCFAVYQELVQLLMAVSTNRVERFNYSSVLDFIDISNISNKKSPGDNILDLRVFFNSSLKTFFWVFIFMLFTAIWIFIL